MPPLLLPCLTARRCCCFSQANHGVPGNIPCYTNIREPVERLVSLYYYMLDKAAGVTATTQRAAMLQDMTPEKAVAALASIWPLSRQTPLLAHFGEARHGCARVQIGGVLITDSEVHEHVHVHVDVDVYVDVDVDVGL